MILYQPKGGMCASCVSKLNDCSHLVFSEMKVIEKYNDIKIVKCEKYTKQELNESKV